MFYALMDAFLMNPMVSFSLISTIDMPKARRALEKQRAEFLSTELCLVNGRSCRRSSCTPAELYPPHERSNFTMLSGRVFDARNRSFQPQVGAILTRKWVHFRLTKTGATNKAVVLYWH